MCCCGHPIGSNESSSTAAWFKSIIGSIVQGHYPRVCVKLKDVVLIDKYKFCKTYHGFLTSNNSSVASLNPTHTLLISSRWCKSISSWRSRSTCGRGSCSSRCCRRISVSSRATRCNGQNTYGKSLENKFRLTVIFLTKLPLQSLHVWNGGINVKPKKDKLPGVSCTKRRIPKRRRYTFIVRASFDDWNSVLLEWGFGNIRVSNPERLVSHANTTWNLFSCFCPVFNNPMKPGLFHKHSCPLIK